MLKDKIIEYYEKEIDIIKALDFEQIENAVKAILDAYEREATIYVFGNGGSAATASHFVGDFNKGISEYFDKKFNLICLNDNLPTMLAIANDISYDEIFAFPLKKRLKSSDLILAISVFAIVIEAVCPKAPLRYILLLSVKLSPELLNKFTVMPFNESS